MLRGIVFVLSALVFPLSFIYTMDQRDIELGDMQSQLVINPHSRPQQLLMLKAKIADFKSSVIVKNIVNMGLIGTSYLFTSYGLLSERPSFLWVGYGSFAASLLVNLAQGISAVDFKGEADKIIDYISQGIPYTGDDEEDD